MDTVIRMLPRTYRRLEEWACVGKKELLDVNNSSILCSVEGLIGHVAIPKARTCDLWQPTNPGDSLP